MFSNSAIKRHEVWRKISLQMQAKGHHVTGDICDKKIPFSEKQVCGDTLSISLPFYFTCLLVYNQLHFIYNIIIFQYGYCCSFTGIKLLPMATSHLAEGKGSGSTLIWWIQLFSQCQLSCHWQESVGCFHTHSIYRTFTCCYDNFFTPQ